MIPALRSFSQQLATPRFNSPEDLVKWMGAIQAQDYNMAKWAIGIRLQTPALRNVEEALRQGRIIRTHIMRPTWHIVAAEDIRWMLKLSGERIQSANEWLAQNPDMEITKDLYYKCNCLLEKILEGHKSLTKEEIARELESHHMPADNYRLTRFLMYAEAKGMVCSGADQGKKATYALLEERVAPAPELTKEEALAKLAKNYFRSHSPASLQDFIWWSGLSATEARQALYSIQPELTADHSTGQELWIHESCHAVTETDEILHLLPSYDEYLISYKSRTAVLAPEYACKAFNNYGIFYPVVLYRNKIIGNWKKSTKKSLPPVEISFFENSPVIPREKIELAIQRYVSFISD